MNKRLKEILKELNNKGINYEYKEKSVEEIIFENIKYKEVLNKIRDKCLSIKGNPEHTIVSKNELVKQFLELLEEIE